MTVTQKSALSALLFYMVASAATGTVLRTYRQDEPVVPVLQSCGDLPMSVIGFDAGSLEKYGRAYRAN